MEKQQLETRIIERGKEFFTCIGNEKPSIFNKNWWTGKMMDWSMKNEDFKLQLFRFIDVLPYLTNEKTLGQHIEEYFSNNENVPAVMKAGIKASKLGGKLAMKVIGSTVRKNIENMALQFIIGETVEKTVKNLAALRKKNFAFTLDVLGEATVSESEADAYCAGYMELLDGLSAGQDKWPSLDANGSTGTASTGTGTGKEANGNPLDWGSAPRVNVSVKPSAMYSQVRPADHEGSVAHILERLKPIYRKVVQAGGFLCIDTEMNQLKHITMDLYKQLRSDPEFRDYPHLGLAMQAYLKEADADVKAMIDWAKENSLPISIRLVKGAYWDYEVVMAHQKGWPVPVYTVKPQTDAAFERCAEMILRNHDVCHFACASHNVRSVCAVMEMAREFEVPQDRYEFQALFGMAEPFRKALLKMTGKVRLYCPHGKLLPGMAYLIRRLLENTSNESFLRQTFVEELEMERLLVNPANVTSTTSTNSKGNTTSTTNTNNTTGTTDTTHTNDKPGKTSKTNKSGSTELELGQFTNEAFADFSQANQRKAFADALANVRQQLGKTYPLYINGQEVTTNDIINSVNPAKPDEVVGRICQAGLDQAEQAMQAAANAFAAWRDTAPAQRALYMVKAAQKARSRNFELAAWQVLEEGKQWNQAYNDVNEAIDFLEYYAREMLRLAEPRYLGHAPGEVNEYFYQPKGVAVVIAPWNFPLAISCGMVAAALVTGNCVVYKPSNLSPIVGANLLQILQAADLPAGVFNYLPGRGSVMGDYVVDHPKTSMIAFTGSLEVGLRIIERAAKVHPGQASVKKVIAEMGGKNAIIVDDDADLDEAVPAIIDSAFAFQGQKCSACSRVIVVDTIYERFVERLVDAARSVKIGPAEDPANFMGPVIDDKAQTKIMEYVELAKSEGNLLFSSDIPDDGGYYVPMTIVDGITPEHRIAQEEVFGPVLAVMRAKDFDQAIEWANSTRQALTGGMFSRSPKHIEQARRDFRVGNLYINRGCTGALVERQPFGGFKMSGIGSKAGGPDYLLQFMDPRCVTENTMRRGFVPVRSDDEWV